MGGDSFEGTQKLTNQQYTQITHELIIKIQALCDRIQPYIPLPQKPTHGDVDFLVILKPQFTPQHIINELKMDKYRLNNNETINSVYRNKQIDFCFVKTNKQFQLASFYKSYSGIGAYLGVFLPSKEIKLTPDGLVALGYEKHLKLEFLICDEIQEIMKFYGLDYHRYKEGFKTRKELFEFIRGVRFLDEEKFAYHEHKAPTKLIMGFSEYLKSTGINSQKKPTIYTDALNQTLEYFTKKQQYTKAFKQLIDSTKRIKQLNQKFNATHLFEAYEIAPKEINQIKKKFNTMMFGNDQDKYYDWVEANELQEIIKEFGEKCGLKAKEGSKGKEEKKENGKVGEVQKVGKK